jgi:copper chaperone
MHEFHLPDMTCGHCASMVSIALKQFDPSCEIQLDLPQHLVRVKSGEERESLVETLTEAGYPPL